MNTFKQFVIEATAQFEGWEDALRKSPMLSAGRDLLSDLERLDPSSENLIVGGAVRDLLLNRSISDVDIATSIDIQKIESRYKTDEIGASKDFGITNVHWKGYEFEVANFRGEEGYSDARRPDKVFRVKSFEQDAARRDFTINALGITKDGTIVDYFGGLEDLKSKMLRAVGDAKQRFSEDALRIYRLLRFASRLGFTIEPNTLQAAKDLVGITDKLASERVMEELYKAAASGPSLAQYIQQLDDIGLLQKILPEIKQLQGKEQHVKHHPEGDAYKHTIAALQWSPSKDPLTNIAILLHDIGKGTTYVNRGTPDTPKHTYYGHDYAALPLLDKIGNRLKLSNDDIAAIKFVAGRHMLLHHPEKLSRNKIVQIVNDKNWPILKAASYADKASRGEGQYGFDKERYESDIDYLERIAKETSAGGGAEGLKKRLKGLINGNLLISWIPALNEPDNRPLIGQILSKLHEWIVNSGRFDLKEDEIKNLALKFYNELLK